MRASTEELNEALSGINTTLQGKAPAVHTHPESAPAVHTHVLTDLPHVHNQYSPTTHNHDANYAATAHNHDASYYTEAESDAKYALTGHTHAGGSGIPGTRTVLSADVTNNNAVANTIADVTGLSFAVTSGQRYFFRFFILYTSAAATTGSRWSINGPATSLLAYRSEYTLTAATQTINEGLAGYNLPAASSASSLTAGNIAQIEGIITPSANGTVIARFASEVASSAIVAKAGSYVEFGTL